MGHQALARRPSAKLWPRSWQCASATGAKLVVAAFAVICQWNVPAIRILCAMVRGARLCRFRQGQLIEVNAHSLFSKWFSESGKLVSKLFSKIMELVCLWCCHGAASLLAEGAFFWKAQ
jgi:hypothetical protein